MIIEIDTSDLTRALRVARLTAKCDCQEKGGDVNNHFASIICNELDRLTKENEELRHELANLVYAIKENTGSEPYKSCLEIAIDDADKLLKGDSQ